MRHLALSASCQGREVQVLGGADRWWDSYHTVNIFFYLPNSGLVIFSFPAECFHPETLTPSKFSFHRVFSPVVVSFYGCIYILNHNPALPLVLLCVSAVKHEVDFLPRQTYTADQRSYKQEFRHTLQDRRDYF